mgnify:FL=1
MNIESAQYNLDNDGKNTSVQIVVDGKSLSVPMDENNMHYAEIQRQVAEGTLTIKDAE